MSSYRKFRLKQQRKSGVRDRLVAPLLSPSVIRRLVAQLVPAGAATR